MGAPGRRPLAPILIGVPCAPVSPLIARRHAAARNLCLLGTLRSDGFPRISPIEPRVFDGRLVLVGMPGTTKFRDLERDPRFTLHTATVDPEVKDGDAKLWGVVVDDPDAALHQRFAEELFEETGIACEAAVLDYVGEFLDDSIYAEDHGHVFELRLSAEPAVRIDRREVVWAGFLRPDEALARGVVPVARMYLERVVGRG